MKSLNVRLGRNAAAISTTRLKKDGGGCVCVLWGGVQEFLPLSPLDLQKSVSSLHEV